MANSDLTKEWFKAVDANNIDKLKSLLQEGIDINCSDGNKRTAFILAATKLDGYDMCEYLLSNNELDVNKSDKNGYTALIFAIKIECRDIVWLLLNSDKVDIDKADNEGYTPLMWASVGNMRYKGKRIAERLLQLGAKTYGVSDDNYAIDIAWMNNHSDLVNLLKEYGLKLSLTKQWFDAVNKYQIHLLKSLLEQGVDINCVNDNGSTALIIATGQLHGYDICSYLLTREDLNANIADKSGYTALIEAIKHKRRDIVWLLLDSDKVDIDKADNEGYTALMWATKMPYDIDVIEQLLELGANSSCVTNDKKMFNAMDLARISTYKPFSTSDSELVELLKRYNMEEGPVTQWFKAVENRSIDKMESLLQQGVDINCTDKFGYTALVLGAMQSSRYEVCEYLLSKNGVVIHNGDHESALITAMTHRRENIAWLLLNSHKLNIDKRDKKRLIECANRMNMNRIAERLKELEVPNSGHPIIDKYY